MLRKRDNMRRVGVLKILFISLLMIGCETLVGMDMSISHAEEDNYPMEGTVNATVLNIRTGPGQNYPIKKYGNNQIKLTKGTGVKILMNKSSWYYVSFTYRNSEIKGYGSAEFISVKKSISGMVNTSVLNVRKGAGTKFDILTVNGCKVQLEKGTKVRILKNLDQWYYVTFPYNNKSCNGYVSSDFVQMTLDAKATEMDTFVKGLEDQNFPDSYISCLKKLHENYPNWEFRADETGLEWNNVLEKESRIGLNLIPNDEAVGWKSLEKGSYQWATDTFIPYDGNSWVNVSKEGLAYYMDPRNFLTEKGIFQFEQLNYMESVQDREGVESILSQTPMYGTRIYCDSKSQYYYYSDLFMKAAKESNVSPYHLASRSKQEVVLGKSKFSNSVTGNVPGYYGYFNFFNIGANNSTVSGGAIKSGLSFAKTGSGCNKETYLIPWTDSFRAIVGGAKYIGESYINLGQDTVYLEKFNVTNRLRYNHQYMSNVQAAGEESVRSFEAYSGISDFKNMKLVFSIPVYQNMPDTKCLPPSEDKNPNNWLKSLSISGQSMTPTFDVNQVRDYYLITDKLDSIKISAEPASKKATVSGTGKIFLKKGLNTILIKVTAENKDIRTYTIHVTKQ